MSPESIRTQLQNSYNIICFLDLADVCENHKKIYDILQQLYQPTYSVNDRLIFYTSSQLDQKIIDYIQRAVITVDISNSFVLILSPYDISEQLSVANKKFCFDDTRIEFDIVPIESKDLYPNGICSMETICPMPFTSIIVDSRLNSAQPCCDFKTSVTLESTLAKTFDKFEPIRRAMIAGEKVPACKTCWDLEKNNLTSLRQHELIRYKDFFYNQLDEPKLQSAFIFPTNLCNFSCRICKPSSSSTIAVEEYKHAETEAKKKSLKMFLPIISTQENINFFKDNDTLEHLNHVHITGGEPFMWPELKKFLSMFVDTGRSNHMTIEFNTNGSVYPAKIIDLFKQFRHVLVNVSIDDIGPRFEIQRGGHWAEVFDNIKRMMSIGAPVQVKFIVTVNLQNILYLDQLIDLAKQLNIDIIWWYLKEPTFMSIDRVTDAAKKMIVEKYANSDVLELRNIADRVSHATVINDTYFIDYINKLDQRRNQSFKDAHKEIFDAMSR